MEICKGNEWGRAFVITKKVKKNYLDVVISTSAITSEHPELKKIPSS